MDDIGAAFGTGSTDDLLTEEEQREYWASLGNIAHRYPINKDLWDKMEDLSVEGAALYSFGIDPDTIQDEIEHCGHEDNSLGELPKDFWERVRIIKSAVRSGAIKLVPIGSTYTNVVDNHTRILKSSFLKWCKDHPKTCKHAEVKPAYPKYQPAIKPAPPITKEADDLSTRERQTLLKIIIGMAITAYGYKPDAERSPAGGEKNGSIFVDLEKAGVPVDADTIRKYLKEAKNYLP